MKYTIDAENRKLGRVATETAVLLMGKNTPDFARNTIPTAVVEVKNVGKISVDAKKRESSTYKRYSGYPGGLKNETLDNLSNRLGMGVVFKKTVSGMLPKNKLRARMLKNLIVTE